MVPGNGELMVLPYAIQYTPGRVIFEVTTSDPMSKTESTYQSYLLRLWHTQEPGMPWRVMLESVAEPGQRHYFKDLQTLTAYLSMLQAQEQESKGGNDIEESIDPRPIQTS